MRKLSNNLNEGVTQYFTVPICAKLGVPVQPAYPEWLAVAGTLATKYGEARLYSAYFKGGLGALLDAMADVYLNYLKAGALKVGKPVYSEKGLKTVSETRPLVEANLQNSNLKWLQARVF